MEAPKEFIDEKERLNELDSYDIMDSETEKDFDNLTKLASEICGTCISLVSLLDDKRQWFKSSYGLDQKETPKEFSFCAHAIHFPDEAFVINDARIDPRFHDNPLVIDDPYVIFYAGIPLITENGYPLGTLCVLDNKPNEISNEQIEALRILSKQVFNLIELRKKKIQLEEQNSLLERKNEEIEHFAYRAAHDLKSPIFGIKMAVNIVLNDESLGEEKVTSMLESIKNSSDSLMNLIDQLFEFSRIDQISVRNKSEISPPVVIENLKSIVVPPSNCSINLVTDLDKIEVNETGLNLVLQNLVTNSIKYCNKPKILIDIGIEERDNEYAFYVKDNGPGIDRKYKEKVFEPFKILDTRDKFGERGTGFGLASVKKVVDKMGGTISFESEEDDGTKFVFTVSKWRYTKI